MYHSLQRQCWLVSSYLDSELSVNMELPGHQLRLAVVIHCSCLRSAALHVNRHSGRSSMHEAKIENTGTRVIQNADIFLAKTLVSGHGLNLRNKIGLNRSNTTQVLWSGAKKFRRARSHCHSVRVATHVTPGTTQKGSRWTSLTLQQEKRNCIDHRVSSNASIGNVYPQKDAKRRAVNPHSTVRDKHHTCLHPVVQ